MLWMLEVIGLVKNQQDLDAVVNRCIKAEDRDWALRPSLYCQSPWSVSLGRFET